MMPAPTVPTYGDDEDDGADRFDPTTEENTRLNAAVGMGVVDVPTSRVRRRRRRRSVECVCGRAGVVGLGFCSGFTSVYFFFSFASFSLFGWMDVVLCALFNELLPPRLLFFVFVASLSILFIMHI